ncbi:hypothetical protein FOQG_09395 [Fusarium oxysporum f. sp. raphani 54005]|uniref:Uncharacterized protein n=2 Tax=Fusarium oxysporum TaxID=5507 RepID=X0BY30_FUSOX|nr:hypothetical protein FOVG_06544 [Fusarium oxysporum f. sp. pisi HDV247]EXK87110.1 hypothetical protein FOQG_09395 [Fusarium oxysporum f. sp. raphani 54005]
MYLKGGWRENGLTTNASYSSTPSMISTETILLKVMSFSDSHVRFGSTQLSSAQPVSDSAQELTTRGSSEYEPRKQSEANADAATEHRGQGGVIFSERSDQIR